MADNIKEEVVGCVVGSEVGFVVGEVEGKIVGEVVGSIVGLPDKGYLRHLEMFMQGILN